MEQVADENIEVRVNALKVLCDEFQNPYSIFGCAQAGVMAILRDMVTDPDYTTRALASQALALAATDANGISALIQDEAVSGMLDGRDDPSATVRGNIYECLYNMTRTQEGVEACCNAGVTQVFVEKLPNESDLLKPTILKALHNIVASEKGLS